MNCTESHFEKKATFKWDSFIPSAITNSMGASVLGGSVFAMPGALVGGVLGLIVAFWSEFDQR
jgi:uncharacterized protein YqgC (DUF456 family)